MKKNTVFVVSIFTALIVIIYGYLKPEQLGDISAAVMMWVSSWFGWLYIAFIFFLCIFLAFLAAGKYGNIRLGGDDAKPLSLIHI